MKLGSYVDICRSSPLPICPLMNGLAGLPTQCYSRGLKMGNLYLMEVPSIFIYIIAMVIVAIMVHAIKNKINGIGQREFITFFYLYLGHLFIELITVTNVVPASSAMYKVLVATNIGTTVTLSWCLLGNGLVIFQFVPDGEFISVLVVRITSLTAFLLTFFVSMGTINSWPGLSSQTPVLLWIIHFILPNLCILLYFTLQLIYLLRHHKSKWLIGDLVHSYCFYFIGITILIGFSTSFCTSSKHYLDGLILHAGFQLASVMMLYKYWFALNIEDTEFEILPLPFLSLTTTGTTTTPPSHNDSKPHPSSSSNSSTTTVTAHSISYPPEKY